MASTSSGSSSRTCGFTTNVPVGTNVIVAYNVGTNLTNPITWNSGAAGAGNIGKVAQLTGSSSTGGASAGDLTSITFTDGTSGSFSHVREIIISNGGAAGIGLILDGSVANNFWSQFLGGTNPTLTIPGGSAFSLPIPLDTNGWVVDSSHKLLQLKSTSSTPAYSIIIVGD